MNHCAKYANRTVDFAHSRMTSTSPSAVWRTGRRKSSATSRGSGSAGPPGATGASWRLLYVLSVSDSIDV